MARGRMVNKKISNSKQVNDLPEMAQLLFTWLIPQLDCNGCFYGSAEMVKSLVFPRKNYTKKMVEGWLLAMEKTGSDGKISPHLGVLGSSKHEVTENLPLIFRYFSNGEQYLYMPGFVDEQPGLRRDREAPEYPQFAGSLPDKCRIDAVKMPAEGNGKDKLSISEVEGEVKYTTADLTKNEVEEINKNLNLKEVRNLPGWREQKDDAEWVKQLQEDYPALSIKTIRACRDWHMGHHPEKKHIWRTALRNWLERDEKEKGYGRETKPTTSGSTGIFEQLARGGTG